MPRSNATPTPAAPSLPAGVPGWFDAHLDLAYLAELGRDLHAPLDDCRGKLLPAAVTLPSLREGAVAACLATVFTEPIAPGSQTPDAEAAAYVAGDAEAARRAGLRQLKLYQAWVGGGAVAELRDTEADATPRLGVLVENADPIESPDHLDEWPGVVAIGLTWARPGRYAHGNASDTDEGLTDLGRAMVARMDDLGIAHDLSHLNRRSAAELLDRASGTVIATHSNCAALLNADDHRHLTDEQIRAIDARGGVIGLNLFTRFLTTEDRRATVADAVAHVEHVCEITGHRRAVGLGSDMDGGFDATQLPEGLDRPAGYARLIEALSDRGWPDADLAGFVYGNWARVLGLA
jgi:membrane dipeptidase